MFDSYVVVDRVLNKHSFHSKFEEFLELGQDKYFHLSIEDILEEMFPDDPEAIEYCEWLKRNGVENEFLYLCWW